MKTSKLELSPGSKAWLDDHLAMIRKKIVDEAFRSTQSSSATEGDEGPILIDPALIPEAAKKFAPGGIVPPYRTFGYVPFWSRMAESISGITVVSAILALGFGFLGFKDSTKKDSWLDISKIFAGAIVGSAGVAVSSSIRKKSTSSE